MAGELAGAAGWGEGAACAGRGAGPVVGAGEALHGRLKPFGVEVTTICPGFVQSAMTDANRFKMPFLMKTDRAVDIMVRGMEAGKVRVAFPWQITWPLGIASVVPSFIATRLNSLKRKPKLPPID